MNFLMPQFKIHHCKSWLALYSFHKMGMIIFRSAEKLKYPFFYCVLGKQIKHHIFSLTFYHAPIGPKSNLFFLHTNFCGRYLSETFFRIYFLFHFLSFKYPGILAIFSINKYQERDPLLLTLRYSFYPCTLDLDLAKKSHKSKFIMDCIASLLL